MKVLSLLFYLELEKQVSFESQKDDIKGLLCVHISLPWF